MRQAMRHTRPRVTVAGHGRQTERESAQDRKPVDANHPAAGPQGSSGQDQ
ncbi:ribosomal protein S12 [Mycobacterium tuberculosis variant africanum K85]|uniref:Ribosomal protein S12 n=1 Tax=Mycobacterium tuberculosis variant africanum K85 TaxID=611304 RepID=A0A9P2H5U9_MYCTX|nr:ribosomal protein S12 [Mycobacterium tuberculosis T46]EFD42297.1 ribosomal protein S12 [Mycobacterium tuberculosis variant africanum K85]